MNTLFVMMVLVSSISFIIYGSLLLLSPKMQDEFKRFGLEKFTKLTGVLELLGGIGMLTGLMSDNILLISSGGLTLLMLLGFIVRLKVKDGFRLCFPSFFFMILNLYVFIMVL